MDNDRQIIVYLEELAEALADLQVTTPFHILIAGGAYMLLQKKRRSTLDIDFALVEISHSPPPDEVFAITIKRAEISGKKEHSALFGGIQAGRGTCRAQAREPA